MEPGNDLLGSSEVLSQSEVEKLLAQVAEQENSVTVISEGSKVEQKSKDAIHSYDFRHPVFLSAAELRKLRLRHEEFIRALSSRMSIFLRLEFTLQMSKLQTVTYAKFLEGLANPTQLTLFKVDPLRGIGVLDVHPRLGLTIVDRLLGGPAHSVSNDREFSDIEMALLDQALELILGEWCNNWSGLMEFRPTILGHENNGRFLQTSAHDAIVLVLAMEARIGDCMEQLQLAFPCSMLEPLIRKLSEDVTSGINEPEPADTAGKSWRNQYDDVEVPVTAVWQDLQLKVRDVTQMKPGDILQFDANTVNRIRLCLAGQPKFVGTLGVVDNKWAVQITDLLNKP